MRRFVVALILLTVMIVTSFSVALADRDTCVVTAGQPMFLTLDAAKLALQTSMYNTKRVWGPVVKEMARQGFVFTHNQPAPAIIIARPSTGIGWMKLKLLSPKIITVYVWSESVEFQQ